MFDPRSAPSAKAFQYSVSRLQTNRPLCVFAGIRSNWSCVQKKSEGEVTCEVYGFLTGEPNAVVAPIHPQAAPLSSPGPRRSTCG